MNILAKMLGLLTSAYNKTDERNAIKGLPMETNIGRLFSVVSWGFGLIDANAERVRLWANIDNAAGATLDRHGANFGVARGGSNDVFYRLLIKVKILAQLSGGDIETILSAISSLYGIDPARVELYEIFPAKIQVAISEGDLPADYYEIKDLVGALTKRLLVAGVGMDMLYLDEDRAGTELFIGGRPVSEYTRIRLDNHLEEAPELSGQLVISGRAVSEFTRIRLEINI